MVGILGSGFGLYGYLPAVADGLKSSSAAIVLPERYRAKFEKRPELSDFASLIDWVPDEAALYKKIDTLIVCLSPARQVEAIKQALSFPNIKYLLLEKPLAVNPTESKELLDLLIASKVSYRIGYNFRTTQWGVSLLNAFKDERAKKVTIQWDFKAHHYIKNLENWKRYNSQGGGVIRFYGIHLIALAAQSGECKITSSVCHGYSEDEMYKWNISFEINSKHHLEIEIDSNSNKTNFLVNCELADGAGNSGLVSYILKDPFELNEYNSDANQDRRVGYLKHIISELYSNSPQSHWNDLYLTINSLWTEIERKNILIKTPFQD